MFVQRSWPTGYLRLRARVLRVEKRLTLDELSSAWRCHVRRSTTGSGISARSAALLCGPAKEPLRCRRNIAAARGGICSGRLEFDQLLASPTFATSWCCTSPRVTNAVAMRCALATPTSGWSRWPPAGSHASRRSDLAYELQYHADQDLDELRAFWGEVLGIDGVSIRLQRKSNSGQLNGRRWRSQHGVLTVGVNDTLLRARLQAWIDCVRDGWG